MCIFSIVLFFVHREIEYQLKVIQFWLELEILMTVIVIVIEITMTKQANLTEAKQTKQNIKNPKDP